MSGADGKEGRGKEKKTKERPLRFRQRSLLFSGSLSSDAATPSQPPPPEEGAEPSGAWRVGSEDSEYKVAPTEWSSVVQRSFGLERMHNEKKQSMSKGCIIDPRLSKVMARWDLTTTICLIFTALFTP